MDQHKPFQVFLLEQLDFSPNRYEIYQDGRLQENGTTNMTIRVRSLNKMVVAMDNIQVNITNNNLSRLLDSKSSYDVVMTLHDRFLALILPRKSNIDDMMFHTLSMVTQYTRQSKRFADKEPLCMSMFTSNGRVVKVSFKVYSPETLIELYV